MKKMRRTGSRTIIAGTNCPIVPIVTSSSTPKLGCQPRPTLCPRLCIGAEVDEVGFFKKLCSLEETINLAALAIDGHGKRFPHQRRIPLSVLETAKSALLDSARDLTRCKDFDSLFDLVEKKVRHIHGIGDLYVYDTALRIGAKLDHLPQKVYLHAGTRKGAKALGLDYKARFLEIEALPQELRRLPPYRIEDALCWLSKEKLK